MVAMIMPSDQRKNSPSFLSTQTHTQSLSKSLTHDLLRGKAASQTGCKNPVTPETAVCYLTTKSSRQMDSCNVRGREETSRLRSSGDDTRSVKGEIPVTH